MKNKIFALLMIAMLGGIVTGCVETVDGRSQAAVPFVKDRVEGRYERPVAQVLEAARVVIKQNGLLTGDNTVNNSLEGRVNQAFVWVHVEEIDPSRPVSRVLVQVRTKSGGSNIDMAHDLEKQIAVQLFAH